jgi:hypothetical protein
MPNFNYIIWRHYLHYRLSTIATFSILCLYFYVPPNPNAYPTFIFGKTMHRNPTKMVAYHKNKWKNVGLMNAYYVVMVTSTPYMGFGVIINIFPMKISHTVSQLATSHIAHAQITCPLMHWEKNKNECIANIFIMCLDFCAKWITKVTSSFMHLHIPTTRSCNYPNLLVL